jgi:hypothetical protein
MHIIRRLLSLWFAASEKLFTLGCTDYNTKPSRFLSNDSGGNRASVRTQTVINDWVYRGFAGSRNSADNIQSARAKNYRTDRFRRVLGPQHDSHDLKAH